MSFVDRHLMPGETLIYRTRLHWALLLPHIVLMLVFAAALVAVSVTVKGVWVYFPLALLVISVFRALGAFVRYQTSEFAVTTHRVMVKLGLISIRSTEILLQKIEAIQIEQDVWGRVLGYGTVLITGTGGTHELFQVIERPYELRTQVQSQLVAQPPPQPAPAPRPPKAW